MVKAVDIRKGQAVQHEGQLWIVHEASHVAKGNKRSYMQVKLKNFKGGNVVDFRFNVDDRIETPYMNDHPYEYLYRDGENFVLMDSETFEQVFVSGDLMGDAALYLKGNERLQCKLMEGQIIGVDLPHTVELAVADTPPMVKGATATNQNKDAVMETGLKVKVPPFITNGEVLRIDTRTGEYIERA